MSSEMQVFTGESKLELVEGSILDIESKNIEVLPYGIRATAFVHRDEWNGAVLAIQKANTLLQWYLGDLVVIADSQWKGEMYDIMENSTGYEYQTLKNFSSVARAYPPEIREKIYKEVQSTLKGTENTKLWFTHFKYVAPLMNKEETKNHAIDFLIRAGRQGWSVSKLIEEILRWKNGGNLPDKEGKTTAEWIVQYKSAISILENEDADFVEVRGMRGNEVVFTERIGIPRLEDKND